MMQFASHVDRLSLKQSLLLDERSAKHTESSDDLCVNSPVVSLSLAQCPHSGDTLPAGVSASTTGPIYAHSKNRQRGTFGTLVSLYMS